VDRAIRSAGIAYLIALASYLVLSPFLAAVAPFVPTPWQPRVEGAGRVILALMPPQPLRAWVQGASALNDPGVFAVVYASILAVATLCWSRTVYVLCRDRDSVGETTVRSTFRWSVALAAIVVFATPVVVHDFWLSVGWGRLIAAGQNPYYAPIVQGDLPLRPPIELMTYGPLWAILTGASAAITGGSLIGTAVIQKLLVAGAWIGCIAMVRRLTRDRGPGAQAIAITMTGWAPIGLFHGVADGHTDTLMAFPMLLWLYLIGKERSTAGSLALAASIAIKYVTAPLMALHVYRAVLSAKGRRIRWVVSAGICLTVVLLLIAIFYRSPEFFSSATGLRQWRFFTPTALVDGQLRRMGVGEGLLAPAIDAVIGGIVVLVVVARLRKRSESALRSAILWTLFGILLCTVGHVWPWYMLWVLPLAAVQLERRLAWFVIGMSAAAPFVLLPWTVLPELAPVLRLGLPGAALYLAGFGGLMVGRSARVATFGRS
jgi:hypothetical protein